MDNSIVEGFEITLESATIRLEPTDRGAWHMIFEGVEAEDFATLAEAREAVLARMAADKRFTAADIDRATEAGNWQKFELASFDPEAGA